MRRLAIFVIILALIAIRGVDAANGIIITFKSAIFSTVAGALTCTPTWTPTANSLIVAFASTSYASAPVDPTGITGHGLTYTALTLGTSTFPVAGTHKVSAWVAKAGASPTSVACVSTVSGTTTGGSIVEFEVVGADVSGTAAQAIQVSNATNTGTSTTPTVTLATPTLTGNRAMTFVVVLANAAPTTSGTWTLTAGAAGNYNTPATGVAALFQNSSFNTAGAATTSSAEWRMVGIEIKSVKMGGPLMAGRRNMTVRGVH